MADMASLRSEYLHPEVSLVSFDYDTEAPRFYLNDHNEAVPFRKTGLNRQDLDTLRSYGIEL